MFVVLLFIRKTAPEVRLLKAHTQSYSVNEPRKSLKVNDFKLGVFPMTLKTISQHSIQSKSVHCQCQLNCQLSEFNSCKDKRSKTVFGLGYQTV